MLDGSHLMTVKNDVIREKTDLMQKKAEVTERMEQEEALATQLREQEASLSAREEELDKKQLLLQEQNVALEVAEEHSRERLRQLQEEYRKGQAFLARCEEKGAEVARQEEAVGPLLLVLCAPSLTQGHSPPTAGDYAPAVVHWRLSVKTNRRKTGGAGLLLTIQHHWEGGSHTPPKNIVVLYLLVFPLFLPVVLCVHVLVCW